MLRVPGMGTMKGRWASSHAKAIWAGVAFFALATRVRTQRTAGSHPGSPGWAREAGAHIGLGVEAGAGVDLAGQVALPEWTPRNETDAQLLAGVEDAVVFRVAFP